MATAGEVAMAATVGPAAEVAGAAVAVRGRRVAALAMVDAADAAADPPGPGVPPAWFVRELAGLLARDAERWRLLGTVRDLVLPDCWVGAGFVRNAVWDDRHGRPTALGDGDVDVVWFDRDRVDPSEDRRLEGRLQDAAPGVVWSVKNQARMHGRNGDLPYLSTEDAVNRWPETATAVAVRRTRDDGVEVCAPWGLHDLFALLLRPTPRFAGPERRVFEERVRAKGWLARWPLLRMADPG